MNDGQFIAVRALSSRLTDHFAVHCVTPSRDWWRAGRRLPTGTASPQRALIQEHTLIIKLSIHYIILKQNEMIIIGTEVR